MSNPNVEYLGVMAWAAQFQWIQDKIAPGDRVQIQCSANKIRVGDEVSKLKNKLKFLVPNILKISPSQFLK